MKGKVSPAEITHLITVSCTGMAAPGLDILLVNELGLNKNVSRTSVNFMGCYAALHALKQADCISGAYHESKILVVCVELCTLHLRKGNDSENNFVNLLFGDGAAAALVTSEGYARKSNLKGLKMLEFFSEIAFEGVKDMGWRISENGFVMSLSPEIPNLIKKGIKDLVHRTLDRSGRLMKDISHWAIHPGGKKILDVIAAEMSLNGGISSSYKVLENYGNMSSPTILFILKDIWENKLKWGGNECVFSAAFGPGLTMETLVLESLP